VGLFTRMGVRYGSHVLELGLLPILMLGVQMNL
jgi:hypothetical protein